MTAERRSFLRTWTFWVWWGAMTTLVLGATCGDPLVPPVVDTQEDTTENDTTEQQGSVVAPTDPGTPPNVIPGS